MSPGSGASSRRTGRGQLTLRLSPTVAFFEVSVAEAQDALIAWRHPLHLPDDEFPAGRPYRRPFGSVGFAMEDGGRLAAVVILASTINASVSKDQDLHRYNVVDLARIARSPHRRDRRCLRAVLRIAVEYLVPTWLGRFPGWDARSAELADGRPQIAAVASTSLPGTLSARSAGHSGLYRFDGFDRLRVSTGPKGGARQRPSAANRIANGERGLWTYRYPTPLR
jgi:hypothetical protein